MKIIEQISFDAVVLAWLRAEWIKHGYDNHYAKVEYLINNPNLNDIDENELRLVLLRARRDNILSCLPQDTEWFLVSYEPQDIKRTYIIPSEDWLPVTSDSYYLPNTIKNVGKDVEHGKWIQEIFETLPNPKIDTKAIMIASAIDSRLTVIEGNHRTVALVKYQTENPNNPLLTQAYLGISKNMDKDIWHIEHPQHKKFIDKNPNI